MTSAEALNALLGSTVLAGAVREVWLWFKARAEKADAAKAATEAARVAASAANDAASIGATATRDATVADLLREQIAAGEARAEKSAERAVTIAAALTASATATADLARAVDRVPDALDALDDRLGRVERAVAVIEARTSPPTGEHRAAGVS